MAGMMGPGNQGPPAGGGGGGFIGPGGGGPPMGGAPGGQMGGPGAGYPGDGGYAPPPGAGGAPLLPSNTDDIAAIEKKVQWKFLFFGGACCAVAAGVIAVVHFIFTLFQVSQWSPFTFLSCVFLIIFGALMLALDLPFPHPNKQLHITRVHIYQFALFLTRFSGRGVWYLFLGTHTWVALYDDGINTFLAVIFTLYLVLLGMLALGKGFILSRKLQDVRVKVLERQIRPERYMTDVQKGMDLQQFSQLVAEVEHPAYFTESELGYVVNALSFTPYSDSVVSLEEFNYWLMEGPMLWV